MIRLILLWMNLGYWAWNCLYLILKIRELQEHSLRFSQWQYWTMGVGSMLILAIAVGLFFQKAKRWIALSVILEVFLYLIVGIALVGPLTYAFWKM